jgi:hypothetical protein
MIETNGARIAEYLQEFYSTHLEAAEYMKKGFCINEVEADIRVWDATTFRGAT